MQFMKYVVAIVKPRDSLQTSLVVVVGGALLSAGARRWLVSTSINCQVWRLCTELIQM